MSQSTQYTYTPPPNEMPIYEALFTAADPQNTGYITGPSAVSFLSTSKLPVDLLKTIWGLSDVNPTNNTLDKSKFIVAVRLIQLFQNGKRPVDKDLGNVLLDGGGEGMMTMRPPYFEGIVLPIGQQQQQQQQQSQQQPQMVQQQQQPQQQEGMASPIRPTQSISQIQPLSPTPSTALTIANAHTDPYAMTPAEQSRYSLLFPAYATPDNDTNINNNNQQQQLYVHGPAAVALFSKSGLDNTALKHIWTLSDNDPVDNKLDMMEFCIAMHLIVCVTKKNLSMPEVLPGSLKSVLDGSRLQMMQSQQQQQQGSGMGRQSVLGSGTVNNYSQQQQQQQQVVTTPKSPEGGIPSPDKAGMMYNNNGGLPPPPVYGVQQHQQQMNQMMGQQGGQQMMMMGQGNVHSQMGVQQSEYQQQQQQQHAGNIQQQPPVGGETIDDAFAGLSNSPVEDVDEYSTVGGSTIHQTSGGSVMGGGGGMSNHGNVSNNTASYQTKTSSGSIPQPPTPSRVTAQHNLQFAPTSPHASKYKSSHAPPTSPAPTVTSQRTNNNNNNQLLYSPSASSRKIKEDEEFNTELEKLRTAHQKLQAECVSLRAKASLVSEEEREAQAEMRELASGIAELSMELSGLKDEVAEAKGRLKDSLGVLKAQKEKKESLETAIRDTREIKDSLLAANEAVNEANEAMMKENAHAVAASAAAAEAEAQPELPAGENEDLFSWDAAPVVPPVTHVTQSHNREMSDISHSYGNWGGDGDSVTKKAEDTQSVHSVTNGFQQPAGAMQQPAPTQYSAYTNDQQSFGGNMVMQHDSHGSFGYQASDHHSMGGNPSVAQPAPSFGGFSPMGATPPSDAMVPAPSSGGYDYGIDLMGIGAMGMGAPPIPAAQPDAFHAPAPTPVAPVPVPPPNVPKSPTVAEVKAIQKEALKAEQSFRQSKELVQSLSEQVQNLEMIAKQAEDNLHAAEKKKGSFTGKSKKKKEVAAAQEEANLQRQKANEAREQLAAAQKESESTRKLAEELRQKSEQAELEHATAASMQPTEAPSSNGYDHYKDGAIPSNNTDVFGGMGFMGSQNQGGYDNPFAMG